MKLGLPQMDESAQALHPVRVYRNRQGVRGLRITDWETDWRSLQLGQAVSPMTRRSEQL